MFRNYKISMKRILLILFFIALVLGGLYLYQASFSANADKKETISPIQKVSNFKDSVFEDHLGPDKSNEPKSDLADDEILNILLLGIDRRSRFESSYRTDIMILVSVNKTKNKVLLTSVPRDLWYGGERINAQYILNGWEGIQNAFFDITGHKPERFILTDFEDFSWIIDQMGGVPVNVEISFTDNLYPNDITNEYQTISFTAGPQKLTGDEALIYSRSRKGDNDNGDWGRMKRQHIVLKGMLDAITQPQSFLCKLSPKKIATKIECIDAISADTLAKSLSMVTTNKMDSNLQLIDLEYLWDLYKDRDSYKIDSIFMDYEYVYTPPSDQYGGAWVLAPIGDTYDTFQEVIKNNLYDIPVEQTENVEVPNQIPVQE